MVVASLKRLERERGRERETEKREKREREKREKRERIKDKKRIKRESSWIRRSGYLVFLSVSKEQRI